MGRFVSELAHATQTPIDLAGMLSLAAIASTLAKRVEVLVGPDWIEPICLYVVSALPPASRKSAVFGQVTAPLREHERREVERLAPEIEIANAEQEQIRQQRDKAIGQAVRAKDDAARAAAKEEAQRLSREMAANQVPVAPRLIVDDVTAERLGMLLEEQRGRLGLFSAEGTVFEVMAGRYSDKPTFEIFLHAHAGEDVRVDRVTRPPVFVPEATLTIGLAVQPDVLEDIGTQKAFRGRGLLARILWAIPPSNIGHREIDPEPVTHAARAAYKARMKALLALEPGSDEEGKPRPHLLRLSTEARAVHRELMRWLEPRLIKGAELGDITDWAGKLAGAVARIAGVLHMAERAGDPAPWDTPVGEDAMNRAIAIGFYLIDQAKVAFRLMGETVDSLAHRVLVWLRDSSTERFTARDAQRVLGERVKNVREVRDVLAVLSRCRYIRLAPVREKPKGKGRPPSPTYEVNPLWQREELEESEETE
jgi:hypothetical protein